MTRTAANVALFSFQCSGLDAEAFRVVRFSGEEELSRLFRFELDLSSTDPAISFEDVINKPATFTMMRGDETVPITGIVAHIEQAGRTAGTYAYRAVLVPRLWRLTLYHQSRVFMERAVGDVISQVLQDAGFAAGADFEMSLSRSYKPMPYCVQYRESDFNFISRLMEHEGIFYFFDHSEGKDVLVITDDRSVHADINGDSILVYDDAATLIGDREVVQNVTYREQVVTGKVVLKDYHYSTPDTDLKVESQLNSGMPGLYYDYGGHYQDAGTGKALAKIRNEEIESRRVHISGTSNCPDLRTGYIFSLDQYYRSDLNDKYLVTRVIHRGTQQRAMGLAGGGSLQQSREAARRMTSVTDGTSNTIIVGEQQSREAARRTSPISDGSSNTIHIGEGDGAAAEPEYENTFVCIPAKTPFRPARTTPIPHIPGIMTAKLETAGGDYAYVDDNGEYRAKMHFDLGSASGGQATLPIRMSQPYSGPDYGIHFPNHAGAEVVFACIDGDVNRPLALGTVPNPNNASPVKAGNNMQNVIRTMAGNEILLDDTKAESQIQIKTTDGNTVLFDDKDDRIVIATTNKNTVTLDDKNLNIEVKTKDGHVLLMDDMNKKIGITTKDGHIFSISDEDQLMKMSDKDGKNSFTIDIGNNKLILNAANGNIDLLAPKGTVTIEANALDIKTKQDTKIDAANFDGKAKMDWKMKAANVTTKADMELKQNGMNVTTEASMAQTVKGGMSLLCEGGMETTVKAGAMLTVQSSGPNMVKGTPVMIN